MTAAPGGSRTLVLGPAADLEHGRLVDEVPGFEEAYRELIAIIAARPRRGRPMAGGRWAYALAKRDMPRVRAIYTFNETRIRVHELQATPREYLPPDRGT